MKVLDILLIFGLPLIVSILLSIRTRRALQHDQLLGAAPRALDFFIVTRAAYWIIFGILLVAFALARISSPKSADETLTMIMANTSDTLTVFASVIGPWRFLFVGLSLLTIFLSLGGLFFMGQAAIKQMPQTETLGPQFYQARAKFFFLGLSLMILPLLLGLLMTI